MTGVQQKNFALLGAAGYVAPRHMKAIQETGNRLLATFDPHDSVGILDTYFPDAKYFSEFERFDRYVDKLRRKGDGQAIDFVSIASPNYLHDAHCRFALRSGAHAICEKPLVLNPWNLDALMELEAESGTRIFNVLQLRLHPAVQALKKRVESTAGKRFEVDLTYITSRGPWYHHSWKGDVHKSGGIATNIGVHFFDMLLWVFGDVQSWTRDAGSESAVKGTLELDRATVRWFLSIDASDLPEMAGSSRTFRSLTLDGEEFEFSGGFGDLHTAVYREILEGRGYGLEDARPSIDLIHKLR